MSLRVRVSEDRCQGHTLCYGVAPAIFRLREEDGHAYVARAKDVDVGDEHLVRRAALGCPEQAIEISGD